MEWQLSPLRPAFTAEAEFFGQGGYEYHAIVPFQGVRDRLDGLERPSVLQANLFMAAGVVWRSARVIDGAHGTPRANEAIVIRDGRLSRIGPAARPRTQRR